MLAGTAMAVASPAIAGPVGAGDAFDLTLGGFFRMSGYTVSEDVSLARGRGYRLYQGETQIWANGSAKGESGLTYGFGIELNAASDDVTAADEAWIFIAGNEWGRVEIGDQDDVGNRMTIDPGTSGVLKGHAAFYGGLGVQQWFNFGTSVVSRTDMEVLLEGGGREGDATKITYFSPRFSGFGLGVSFAPDTGQSGFTRDADNDGDVEKLWVLAANWFHRFDRVAFSAGGAWWLGQGEAAAPAGGATVNDSDMWRVGAKVDYRGIALSAAYMDLNATGVTGANSALGEDAGEWWAAGASYVSGSWGLSAGYFASERSRPTTTLAAARGSTVDWLAFGVTYTVAPGWALLADLSFITVDNINSTTIDNSGHVFGVSSQFVF